MHLQKNNKGEFNMEKTVKLEQFKKLTEKELQKIQGGDKRLLIFFLKGKNRKHYRET